MIPFSVNHKLIYIMDGPRVSTFSVHDFLKSSLNNQEEHNLLSVWVQSQVPEPNMAAKKVRYSAK